MPVDHPELLRRLESQRTAMELRPKRLPPRASPEDTVPSAGRQAINLTGATDRAVSAAARLASSGRALWAELHPRALTYVGDEDTERAWLSDFGRRVPCGECRISWANLLRERPPDLTDTASYFAWTVWIHNRINRKLDKVEVGEEEARRIWSQS